jgi:transcriptional regulator with XRE-family HTH domain
MNNILITRIRELRELAGLSQAELGVKLGITQSAIASWESGRNEPPINMLVKMSMIYGCSINYLVGVAEPAQDDIDARILTQIHALTEPDKVTMLKILSALADKDKDAPSQSQSS